MLHSPSIRLRRGLVHEVDVHIQARMVLPEYGFQVSCLQRLADAAGADSPEGAVHILAPKGQCQRCQKHLECGRVPPVCSSPESLHSFLDGLAEWVQYAVGKEHVDVVRSTFSHDVETIHIKQEAGIRRTKTTIAFHIQRTPRNVVLDKSVVQQRGLPRHIVQHSLDKAHHITT